MWYKGSPLAQNSTIEYKRKTHKVPIIDIAYSTALPNNQEFKECPAIRDRVAGLGEENANVFYLPSVSVGSIVSIHSFFFLLLLLLLFYYF